MRGIVDVDRTNLRRREWTDKAISIVEADANRSADTHLIRLPLPPLWHTAIYLKDESTHPSGSLKHRLARSLFLYALCNGWIEEKTIVVDASSGSTAVSEAYFASLLGLRFVAVVPKSTSEEKVLLIRQAGGDCRFVDDAATIYQEAARYAAEVSGCYLDQFTYAERATDWRGNNNIAESIFSQMECEAQPVPSWIIVGAGTGGTSATIGRYIRYKRLNTELAVVDPEGSAFFPGWRDHLDTATGTTSRIEGIGRPRVEPSFEPNVVDRMLQVPDAASVAAMRLAGTLLGRRVGPSTGTNLWGTLYLATELQHCGVEASLVTLLCDSGDRYADTYYTSAWLDTRDIVPAPYEDFLEQVLRTVRWPSSCVPEVTTV